MNPMDDDRELLRPFVEQRSNEAFTAIVGRYLPLVHSVALRQLAGDVHCAREVAQTVFIILAQKARVARNPPVLSGWLYTTTYHAAAKLRRAEGRRRKREQEACAMQEEAEGLVQPAEWQTIGAVIDQAMLELPERDRIAVLMRFCENRPFAEIAPPWD